MEVIRKFFDANALMSIMASPEAFKLEIIVLPTDEDTPVQQKADVEDVVQSLVGAIPCTGLTLAELCVERLGRYETVN